MKDEEIMTVEDALAFTECILHAPDNCYGTPMGKKIIDLLYAKCNAVNVDFDCFLGEEQYFSIDRWSCSRPEYWKNIDCKEPGWNWIRYTGAKDWEEINYSNMFLYECTLFSLSYLLYSIISTSGPSYEEFLSGDTYGMVCEEVCELVEMENDSPGYAKLIVYGARYIDCKLSGEKMPKHYLEEMERLYKEEDCAYMGACKYFDSFFTRLGDFSDDPVFVAKAMPYLLDVVFGFKQDNECTPTFYFFTSEPMKEYKDLRDSVSDNQYVPYLDKLLTLLEDPASTKQFVGHAGYDMDVLGMRYNDNLAATYEYMDSAYVAMYYYYQESSDSELHVEFNPLFFGARKCFMILLEELKKSISKVA